MSELRTNRIIPRDGLPSGSAGGIIQVKNTTKTDPWAHPGGYTAYAQVTGLNVTITPTRADSKILIFANLHGVGDSSTQAYFRFMRDSTAICVATDVGSRVPATLGSMYEDQTNDTNSCSQHFLDSPSTTSAVTYKIQARTQGSGSIYLNRSAGDQNNSTSGRFTSTLTVMEVSG